MESSPIDIEQGVVRPIAHDQYADAAEMDQQEEHALLASHAVHAHPDPPMYVEEKGGDPQHHGRVVGYGSRWPAALPYVATFLAGVVACLAFQFYQSYDHVSSVPREIFVEDHDLDGLPASSTSAFHFPPTKPTNWDPALFPTDVGFRGPTITGNEPGLIATAPSYPVHTGAPQLIGPASLGGAKSGKPEGFDIFRHWGNLSPWYTVPSADFGLPEASPEPPSGCSVTGLHFLHRHGARYPTASGEGPDKLKYKLENATRQGVKWHAEGGLEFLNKWEFNLGNELLTPFGRQQMYDLGVNLRIKYGFLLQNFTDTLPVFRTESQDRMLHSALNFAIGFFGYPIDGQYLQSITYEGFAINNTLAPYMTCPNAMLPEKAGRGLLYVSEWVNTYLSDAAQRLQGLVHGLEINQVDVYNFQELCAYETVALGYSRFCELFTEEEWEGFSYALDLHFWYESAFGSPVARAQGIGYIQELVARLTHTPIQTHNSSTNATLDDNPTTFPLHQPLYVDATHEVVVLNVITALNLSNFAATGPLPSDHIPSNRSFYASKLAPFGTNIQFQLLSCSSTPEPQIRVIINDGVTPLTGIAGCPANKDGMCSVDTFVTTMKKIIGETDWTWDCHGDWTVPPGAGWNTTTGSPPAKP